MNPEARLGITFGAIVLVILVAIACGWWWYINNFAPRPYPTGYNNFFWGCLQGLFIVPTYVVSLFSDQVAIHQAPNGNWYDTGFMAGSGMFSLILYKSVR